MDSSNSARHFLGEVTSLSRDALHIYIGLAVLLLAVVLWKKPLSDWRPIALVVLASLSGPIWRYVDTLSHGGTPRWHADWLDVWQTLFWPTILFGLARFTNALRR